MEGADRFMLYGLLLVLFSILLGFVAVLLFG
jgi:hypothetical protein